MLLLISALTGKLKSKSLVIDNRTDWEIFYFYYRRNWLLFGQIIWNDWFGQIIGSELLAYKVSWK